MATQTFIVEHTDDYRAGPYMSVLDSEEEASDYDVHTIELLVNQKYRVYQCAFDMGEVHTTFLKEFENEPDASDYCLHQFYLVNEEFPFRQTGMTSTYHPTGERTKTVIPENIQLDLKHYSNDPPEYLIVVSENHFESYSLNVFSVWD